MANVLARLRQMLGRVPAQQQSGRHAYRIATDAGVPIDHDNAMCVSAVWACVRVIAQTIGVLSMHAYQSKPNGGKTRRTDLRIDQMMRRNPNAYMTAMTLRETMTAHVLTWGNAYAEIERDLAGRPIAMWILLPDRTYPILANDGSLWYETSNARGGERYVLPAADVFHLKGFGFDGLVGYDVIAYAARSIGAATAAETFASSFFANGTQLSGGLFHPKRLSKEAKQGIREEFERTYKGSRNAFRMAIFEEGVDWKQFGLSPEAAQFLETRQFSVEDVARWFGVPLHKVGHLLRATNNNIEHQGIEFVVDTILPMAVRWEQEADSKLLTAGLRNDHFWKLNVATLMRGDMASRYAAYEKGRLNGWLNANQICELEDLDPIGPAGDVYIVPLNYQNADRLLDPPAPPPAPAPAPGATPPDPNAPDPATNAGPKRATRAALVDAAGRGLRRLNHALKDGADEGLQLRMIDRMVEDLSAPAAVFWSLLGGEEGKADTLVRSMVAAKVETCAHAHAAGDRSFAEAGPVDRFVENLISSLIMLRSSQCAT